MKKMQVSINGKDALGRPFSIQKPYQEPENWKEACSMDTEQKAFKIFLNERKTNFQDKERKQELARINKQINEILGSEAIKKALAAEGIELD